MEKDFYYIEIFQIFLYVFLDIEENILNTSLFNGDEKYGTDSVILNTVAYESH